MFDQRNIMTILARIVVTPETAETRTGAMASTHVMFGMGKRKEDGSWRERFRLRLYIRSGTPETFEAMRRMSQWDYVEAKGFLGTWSTMGRYGERMDPCLIVSAIRVVPVDEAQNRFFDSKQAYGGPSDIQRVV
jgi:hypothetical protein